MVSTQPFRETVARIDSLLPGFRRDTSDSGSMHWSARTMVLCAAWFLVWFALYFLTVDHLYLIVTDFEHEIFGVDSQDADLMLRELTLTGVDARKHPFFAIFGRALVVLVDYLPGLHGRATVKVVLAGMGAANVLGLLLVVRRYFCGWSFACIASAFYGVSFASVVILSTPETYSLSSLMVLAYICLFMQVKDQISSWSAVALGAVAGVAGLAHPPLLTLGLIAGVYLLSTRGLRDSIRPAILMLVISVLVFVSVVVAIWGFDYFRFSVDYANDWASLHHFLQPETLLSVVLQLFVYALVSPVEELKLLYSPDHAIGYAGSWLGAGALIGCCLAQLQAFRRLWRQPGAVEISLAIWVLFNTLFWIYFNPAEAVLYAVQLLPCVAVLIALGMESAGHRPAVYALSACVLAAMGIHNLEVVFDAVPPG